MTRALPSSARLTLLLALSTTLLAQQPNTIDAAMILNGRAGPSFPILGVELIAGTTLGIDFYGQSGMPVKMGYAPVLSPGERDTTMGILDLQYETTQVVFDGLYQAGFTTSSQGTLQVGLPIPEGLPGGFTLGVQGAVGSSYAPAGFFLTAASELFTVSSVASGPINNDNSITITAEGWSSGTQFSNYPVRIGRPFVQAEIPNYPRAVLGTTPLLTQADVKNRWPDGSVRFAVISFQIPSLSASESMVVSFADQPSGFNSGAPSLSSMLNNYDFEGTMTFGDGSSTQSASARAMLSAGDYTHWAQGSVASTVILADHSAARTHDVGFDSHRSIRPIFHATFWPSINRVELRYIAEVSNTEALQDLSYDLTLSKGLATPTDWYSKQGITHWAMTRWTKSVWIGGEPPAIRIDHNIDHLKATKYIPNYSSSPISQTAIAGSYSWWASANKDLYGPGTLRPQQGMAGGHPQIGPFPRWDVEYLRSEGDLRMEAKSIGNAELGAAWPMHIREGNTGKSFDTAGTIPGIGRVLSTRNRRTLTLIDLNYTYTHGGDRITPVGAVSVWSGWKLSRSHLPNLNYVPYMVTGDYFFLEEMQFMASWAQAYPNGAGYNYNYGRGPTGREGAISTTLRGMAWTGQQRMSAAWSTPDGTAERTYFEGLLIEAIAAWEGERHVAISGSMLETNPLYAPLYNWGSAHSYSYPYAGNPGPFNRACDGIEAYATTNNYIDTTKVSRAFATWQSHFWMYALGRMGELGYPSARLCAFLAQNYVINLEHPDFSAPMITSYAEPIVDSNTGSYFPDVASVESGWLPTLPVASSGLNTNWNYVAFANIGVSGAQFALDRGFIGAHAPVNSIVNTLIGSAFPSLTTLDIFQDWEQMLQVDGRYVASEPFEVQWAVRPTGN